MASDSTKKDLTLHIEVLSARGLRDADWFPGSKGSDPFCEVTVPGKSLFFKTEVVEDTSDPVWNASTDFTVAPADVLHFAIFDEDKRKKSDRLGYVTLAVAEAVNGFDGELKLLEASSTKWGGDKNVQAFVKLRVAPKAPPSAPAAVEPQEAPSEAPKAPKNAAKVAGADNEELEKLQRLRRASVESGLTIREVRQLSVAELERWLEEEQLRKQRRRSRRDEERGQKQVVEEEGGQWWSPEHGDGSEGEHCRRCAAQLTPGAKFCAACGAPADWEPEETPSRVEVEAPPSLPKVDKEEPAGPAKADELVVVVVSDELPEYGTSSWADTLDSPAPASYEAPAPAAPSELWPEREPGQDLRPLDGDDRNRRLLRLLEGPYASLPKSAGPRMDPWQKLASFGQRPPVQIGLPGSRGPGQEKATQGELQPEPGRWAVSQVASESVMRSSSHFGLEVFRRFLRVKQEPELHWLADEMMHVELPQGMYPIDPMSVECKSLDRHSRCPQPPPALAFAQASEPGGSLEDEGEVFFEHPYQEAFDHAAAAQMLATSSSDPGALLEVAEAAWTHRYGQGLSNWEENLRGGGFVHRVTGHHARKDPRSHILRELQLGCFLIARVRAQLGVPGVP
ncbi:CAR11 [Symbiodinium natans]|uniref:CAR11 protein n=1 Tax=Symbiodinium natans TaxID=878477 RepID=A0A812K594_9DINO|nr:CAR11 [Symbiodinium natans]